MGCIHPDYLLRRLTAKQLREWEVYYNKEPFGQELGFYQSAIISSVIANVNRGKNSRSYKPEDFIPKMYLGEKKKQSVEEMRKILMAMAGVKKDG